MAGTAGAVAAARQQKLLRDGMDAGRMRGLSAGIAAQEYAALADAIGDARGTVMAAELGLPTGFTHNNNNDIAAAGPSDTYLEDAIPTAGAYYNAHGQPPDHSSTGGHPALSTATLDLHEKMRTLRGVMDAPGGNAVPAAQSVGLKGLLEGAGRTLPAGTLGEGHINVAARLPADAARARMTSPVRRSAIPVRDSARVERDASLSPRALFTSDVADLDRVITDIDTRVDERVLQMMATEEREAQALLSRVADDFKAKKEEMLRLEMEVLKTKNATRVAHEKATAVRDDVKMTQAELSCVALEVHALERERKRGLTDLNRGMEHKGDAGGADGLNQERKELRTELMKAKALNQGYAADLESRHQKTRDIEAAVAACSEEDSVLITVLRERWDSVAKDLKQRAAAEEEWGGLKLAVAEDEAEVARLRAVIAGKGIVVPQSVTAARQRYAAKLRAAAETPLIVKKYFAVPTGTLFDLTTTQGYGLQAIRAKHNVVIDVSPRDGWAENIIAISGGEKDVDAARAAIENVCCRKKPASDAAVLTYPRPDNRVGPIATPWARLQQQQAEGDDLS